MAELTTTVCDLCKEKVAKNKCSFCDCDICTICGRTVEFNLVIFSFNRSQNLMKTEVCQNCSTKVYSLKGTTFSKQMQDYIISFLKNNLTVEELKEKPEEKKTYSHTLNPNLSPIPLSYKGQVINSLWKQKTKSKQIRR